MFGKATSGDVDSACCDTPAVTRRDDSGNLTSHVVVDARLRVISHEPTVQSLLKQSAELSLASGSLKANDPDWQQELLGLATSASAQSKTRCSTSPQGTIRVEFRGLCGLTTHNSHTAQLLVVLKSNACAINAFQVARDYGLTPTEADILNALCSGIRVWAYAERKHVSIHTVRKQVKNVRAKLGVQSQIEAVRLVYRARFEEAA